MVWVQLALATPVVLWGGWPFFERAWASLKNRQLNMFTLIAMGTGTAYLFSVVAAIAPGLFPDSFRDHHGEVAVYFEPAAVITTLVLLGQVLELRARAQTGGAIRALLGLAPKTARRLRDDGREEDVPIDRVVPGDRLRDPAGREGAGRRRRARRHERRGRVDDHGRADPGRERAGRPGHRRHGQRHRGPGHAGRAGRRRDDAGPDRPHGQRGAADPRADPAPGRPGLGLFRPGAWSCVALVTFVGLGDRRPASRGWRTRWSTPSPC